MIDMQAIHRDSAAAAPAVISSTRVDYPDAASIHALFLDSARAAPDHVALASGPHTLSYRELAARSEALALRLVARGVAPGDIVMIRMPRGASWVVAMLAVLRAGAAYLPVNPGDPARRIEELVGDARPVAILVEAGDAAAIHGVPVVSVTAADPAGAGALPADVPATSPAYVMYTSGSTGQPKGVVVCHRSVVRLVVNSGIAPLSRDTRLLQTGAATFDATTFEIWGPLLHGGTVVIPDDDVVLEAGRLGRAIRDGRITTMWLTSPLFNHLSAQDPEVFAPVRQLIVGGDVVVGERVASVMTACPGIEIINGYGPTENTTFSTTHRVTLDDTRGRVPIGRPFANSTAYVLDESGAPVARGVPGELYVGGDGVALGYLNKPELTARVFLDDPFRGTGRMYRTGDLAVMRDDGVIEFLGRKDDQVKIRGYRIEPGEIEAALRRHPLVREAVVAVRRRDSGAVAERYLTAYVTTTAWLDERELRAHLLDQLPSYMVPGFLVTLDSLPLSAHGKVDRAALPDPAELHALGAEYVPARNAIEARLLGQLQATLGLGAVGILDSFFDLGIDSLAAARLAAAVNRAFDVRVAVSDVLSNPSVAELAALLEGAADRGPEPRAAAAAARAASDAQPDRAASAASAAPFALSRQQYPIYVEQRKNERSVQYNIPVLVELPPEVDRARLRAAWDRLVARHEALRLEFRMTDGPVQQVAERVEHTLTVHAGAPDLAALIEPFDLDAGPPWRASVHVDGGRTWLFLDLHHLISDGASLSVMFDELASLYRGEELPPVQRQYSDFVRWAEDGAGAAARKLQERFWAERFAAPLQRAELPTDFPRPAQRTNACAVLAFDFGTELARALRSFAAGHDSTLFEVLAAGYGLFLSAVTGTRDVVFGVPATSRSRSGFDRTVGMLANTVCLRVPIEPQQTVAELCREVVQVARGSLSNQDFTFRDLTALVNPEITAGRNPLIDTLLALQGRELSSSTFLGTSVQLRPFNPGEAMFDLNLQIFEGQDDLHAEWEYATELFTAETMAELLAVFRTCVERAIASPRMVVGELLASLGPAPAGVPDPSAPAVFEV